MVIFSSNMSTIKPHIIAQSDHNPNCGSHVVRSTISAIRGSSNFYNRNSEPVTPRLEILKKIYLSTSAFFLSPRLVSSFFKLKCVGTTEDPGIFGSFLHYILVNEPLNLDNFKTTPPRRF